MNTLDEIKNIKYKKYDTIFNKDYNLTIYTSGYCCTPLINNFNYNFYDYRWFCKWTDLNPSKYESLQTFKRLIKQQQLIINE